MIICVESAVMAGLKVVSIKSLADGSLDLEDLRAKAEKHKDNLAAFMVITSFGNDWNGFLMKVHIRRSRTHRLSVSLRTGSKRQAIGYPTQSSTTNTFHEGMRHYPCEWRSSVPRRCVLWVALVANDTNFRCRCKFERSNWINQSCCMWR